MVLTYEERQRLKAAVSDARRREWEHQKYIAKHGSKRPGGLAHVSAKATSRPVFDFGIECFATCPQCDWRGGPYLRLDTAAWELGRHAAHEHGASLGNDAALEANAR